MERETDRRIGAAAAVMRSLYRSVVVKRELSRKAKLSIYWSIYVPALTYGHDRKNKVSRVHLYQMHPGHLPREVILEALQCLGI